MHRVVVPYLFNLKALLGNVQQPGGARMNESFLLLLLLLYS